MRKIIQKILAGIVVGMFLFVCWNVLAFVIYLCVEYVKWLLNQI